MVSPSEVWEPVFLLLVGPSIFSFQLTDVIFALTASVRNLVGVEAFQRLSQIGLPMFLLPVLWYAEPCETCDPF